MYVGLNALDKVNFLMSCNFLAVKIYGKISAKAVIVLPGGKVKG
jgi:hypothetical protein